MNARDLEWLIFKCDVLSFVEVKGLENVEYIEEETMARGTALTYSWALDRIDQVSPFRDSVYNPGTGRNGEGIDIYVFDSGIMQSKT